MIPWTVRYAAAAIAAGRPVPSWLRLAVDMAYNEGGRAACTAFQRDRERDAGDGWENVR